MGLLQLIELFVQLGDEDLFLFIQLDSLGELVFSMSEFICDAGQLVLEGSNPGGEELDG